MDTQEILNMTNNRSIPVKQRAQQLIEHGLKELDLELGIISHVEQDKYTVLYSNNPELIGEEFQLGVTYCQITLTLTQTRVLAVENFAVSEYFRHPAYKAFKLETYIGSPITAHRKVKGTINFTKSTKRSTYFSKDEKEFVKSLGKAAEVIVNEMLTLKN